MSVAAVVLAAGRGERFGLWSNHDSKLVALLDGQPVVRRTVSGLVASGARPIIVVLGHAAAQVGSVLAELPVQTVYNQDYQTGLASSLRVAIAAIPERVEGLVVALGDMPLVLPTTIDRLIARFESDPKFVDAVVPRYDGRNGNPVLIGRNLFPALLQLEGDEGARKLLVEAEHRVAFCEVDDRGIGVDVDTPASLQALQGARTYAADRSCALSKDVNWS